MSKSTVSVKVNDLDDISMKHEVLLPLLSRSIATSKLWVEKSPAQSHENFFKIHDDEVKDL